MKLNPSDLENNGFKLQDELGHKELIPFVRSYMKKRTFYTVFYTICNLIVAVGIVLLFVIHRNTQIEFGDGIAYLSYGFAIAFLLIPLHEFIHVLAYKSQGAKDTSYDTNLKKFYFMAMADKFVANRKEFTIVALAPFAVISLVLILLLFLVDSYWMYTILGILLTHTAFCSGDFGLLSYFEFHKDKEVVTYDDKENRVSYFYAKQK